MRRSATGSATSAGPGSGTSISGPACSPTGDRSMHRFWPRSEVSDLAEANACLSHIAVQQRSPRLDDRLGIDHTLDVGLCLLGPRGPHISVGIGQDRRHRVILRWMDPLLAIDLGAARPRANPGYRARCHAFGGGEVEALDVAH